MTAKIPSKPLRYGLVARIHRSHASASADVAGVRFPVTEFLHLRRP